MIAEGQGRNPAPRQHGTGNPELGSQRRAPTFRRPFASRSRIPGYYFVLRPVFLSLVAEGALTPLFSARSICRTAWRRRCSFSTKATRT